jgi:hypothetical protein
MQQSRTIAVFLFGLIGVILVIGALWPFAWAVAAWSFGSKWIAYVGFASASALLVTGFAFIWRGDVLSCQS